jgi:ribosomal protein S18 acetylase RimI-like enzyme
MVNHKLHLQNLRRYKTDLAHVRPWFKTRDGQKLKVRLLQPEDAALLVDFFLHLSPESRWRRFHANVDHMSERLIDQRAEELAQVDNERLMGAIVALSQEQDGEHIVGSVRLARNPATPDSTEAEAAIVVRDDFHGRGVGQELLRRMVLLAKQMHVKTILAIFQPDNEAAIRLFRELNLPFKTQVRHGETEMRLEVPE